MDMTGERLRDDKQIKRYSVNRDRKRKGTNAKDILAKRVKKRSTKKRLMNAILNGD